MRIRLVLGIAVLSALGGLAGCGDARPRAPASDGERVYLARCTACHATYEPRERTPEEWTSAVAKMERWKKVVLTNEERSLILGYLGGGEKKVTPALPAGSAPSASFTR